MPKTSQETKLPLANQERAIGKPFVILGIVILILGLFTSGLMILSSRRLFDGPDVVGVVTNRHENISRGPNDRTYIVNVREGEYANTAYELRSYRYYNVDDTVNIKISPEDGTATDGSINKSETSNIIIFVGFVAIAASLVARKFFRKSK